jgi:hypothetical protein
MTIRESCATFQTPPKSRLKLCRGDFAQPLRSMTTNICKREPHMTTPTSPKVSNAAPAEPAHRSLGAAVFEATDKAVIIGLRLAKPHTNGRGLIHGGLIAALATTPWAIAARMSWAGCPRW